MSLPHFQTFSASQDFSSKSIQSPKQDLLGQLVTPSLRPCPPPTLAPVLPFAPAKFCPASGTGTCCSLRGTPLFHPLLAQVAFR